MDSVAFLRAASFAVAVPATVALLSACSHDLAPVTPPGTIDTAFANDGLYVIDRGATGTASAGRSVAVGPSGHVWVGGGTVEPGAALLVRLLPDGKPDAAFGTGGYLSKASLPQWFGILANLAGIAALPTPSGGAILVASGAGQPCLGGPYCAITGGEGSALTVMLLYVDATGAPKSSIYLGTVGFAADKVLDATPDGAGGALVLYEGRHRLLEPPIRRVPTLLHFDADGQGGVEFMRNAAAGMPCADLPVDGSADGRMIRLADGRLQVVQFHYPSPGHVNSCAARLDREGIADPASWWTSSSGYFTPSLVPRNVTLLAVLAGPDGSLEMVHRIADRTVSPPRNSFAFVATTPAGSLDPTRFPGGATLEVSTGPVAMATAIVRATNGGYLVAGYPAANTPSGIRIESPRVARYRRDGTLDETFGSGKGYVDLRFDALGLRLAPYALHKVEGALLVAGSAIADDPREPIRLAVTRIVTD